MSEINFLLFIGSAEDRKLDYQKVRSKVGNWFKNAPYRFGGNKYKKTGNTRGKNSSVKELFKISTPSNKSLFKKSTPGAPGKQVAIRQSPRKMTPKKYFHLT